MHKIRLPLDHRVVPHSEGIQELERTQKRLQHEKQGKTLGLETKGILHVLLRGVKEKHQSKEQAKEALRKMLEEGLWLLPAIIHGFHEALVRL